MLRNVTVSDFSNRLRMQKYEVELIFKIVVHIVALQTKSYSGVLIVGFLWFTLQYFLKQKNWNHKNDGVPRAVSFHFAGKKLDFFPKAFSISSVKKIERLKLFADLII